MSNHDVSMDMKYNNGLEVLQSIEDRLETYIDRLKDNSEPKELSDQLIEVSQELALFVGNIAFHQKCIDKYLMKFADVVDAVDLWVGHDSGPENIVKEFRKVAGNMGPNQ